jgi:hypothetical protein
VVAREGVAAFAKLIASNSALRSLAFRPASVWPDADVLSLFGALQRNTTLESLMNHGLFTWLVNPDSSNAIAACLRANRSLTRLHFMCDFGSSSELVESALTDNYALVSVRLAYRRPSTVLQLSIGNRNRTLSYVDL